MVEIIIVVAVIALLVAMILPAFQRARVKGGPGCYIKLRQIGLTLSEFAGDNNSHFPPQVAVTNGGSMELVGTGDPAIHFQTLSNYVSGNWYALHCPGDHSRQPAAKGSALEVQNVSYFLSMDAQPEKTNTILGGDRHLEFAGEPVKPGLFTLQAEAEVGWTREIHFNQAGVPRRNILFADAHVENLGTNLPTAIRRQALPANRLAVP